MLVRSTGKRMSHDRGPGIITGRVLRGCWENPHCVELGRCHLGFGLWDGRASRRRLSQGQSGACGAASNRPLWATCESADLVSCLGGRRAR
jgi:hypothetical protein